MKIYLGTILCILAINMNVHSQKKVEMPDCETFETISELHEKQVWGNPLGPSRIFDSTDHIQFVELKNRLDTTLAALNYINVTNEYLRGRYYLQQGDSAQAVIILKKIMRFPFWGDYRDIYISNQKRLLFFDAFFEIYWKTGQELIDALANNLEELYKLEFVPASHSYLLWKHRDAIERAGGVWHLDDFSFPLQDNEWKNLLEHVNKQENQDFKNKQNNNPKND